MDVFPASLFFAWSLASDGSSGRVRAGAGVAPSLGCAAAKRRALSEALTVCLPEVTPGEAGGLSSPGGAEGGTPLCGGLPSQAPAAQLPSEAASHLPGSFWKPLSPERVGELGQRGRGCGPPGVLARRGPWPGDARLAVARAAPSLSLSLSLPSRTFSFSLHGFSY